MSETCQFPTCQRHPQKNGYCIGHRIYAENQSTKTAGIKKVSEKMVDTKKELKLLYPVYLARHKKCAIQIEGVCTIKATCVNHKNGRGKNEILNVATWEPSCWNCNNHIEAHHAVAEAAGHKNKRHVKN